MSHTLLPAWAATYAALLLRGAPMAAPYELVLPLRDCTDDARRCFVCGIARCDREASLRTHEGRLVLGVHTACVARGGSLQVAMRPTPWQGMQAIRVSPPPSSGRLPATGTADPKPPTER